MEGTRVTHESQDKAEKIRNQVIEALRKLSNERPESKYLLVEEKSLVGLADDIEHLIKVKRLEVIKETLSDIKEYLDGLIENSVSLSSEEKETLMKGFSIRKDKRAQD